MSRFVNTPHGRADPDDPPFTVRTAGAIRPPREPATAATSAVRALDMSAADHTPGASGSAATAAEPAPETTTPTPSTPLLFTADMDTVADPKLDTMMTNLMPIGILAMLMETTDLADGLSLEYEAGQPTELGDTVIGIVNHGLQAAGVKEMITDPVDQLHIRKTIGKCFCDEATKLILDRVIPSMEVSFRQMLSASFTHNTAALLKYISSDSAEDETASLKLDEGFDACISAINNAMLSLSQIHKFVADAKLKEAALAQKRAALDYSDSASAAEIEATIEEARVLTARRTELATAAAMLVTDCVSACFEFLSQSVPANHNRAPKPMNISAKAAQDPNARTGKVVFQDMMTYLTQFPKQYYILLPIFFYICEKQRTQDELIRPPYLECSRSIFATRDLGEGSAIDSLDPILINELRTQSKVLSGVLAREHPDLLRKFGRGRRKFSCTNGDSIVLQPEIHDGLAQIISLVLVHAERSSHLKVNLRDQLECCAGLFTTGPVLKTIQRLQPILEECLQMDISVQYDLSVKSVVLILVERSPIYQQLMGKYVLDVQLDMKRAAVKTLYALMIEIECITRESRTSDTLPPSKSAESNRQFARARLVHNEDAATENEIPADSATTAILCQLTGCNNPLNAKGQLQAATNFAANQKCGLLCDKCREKYTEPGTELEMKGGYTRTIKDPKLRKKKPTPARAATPAAAEPEPELTGELTEDEARFVQGWMSRPPAQLCNGAPVVQMLPPPLANPAPSSDAAPGMQAVVSEFMKGRRLYQQQAAMAEHREQRATWDAAPGPASQSSGW